MQALLQANFQMIKQRQQVQANYTSDYEGNRILVNTKNFAGDQKPLFITSQAKAIQFSQISTSNQDHAFLKGDNSTSSSNNLFASLKKHKEQKHGPILTELDFSAQLKDAQLTRNIANQCTPEDYTKQLLEQFQPERGVKLITENQVLKNKSKLYELLDESGVRRISKNFYETDSEGRIKKIKGVNYDQSFESSQKDAFWKQEEQDTKNGTGEHTRDTEELKASQIEETIKRVESITSQASENAKTSKNMTIFYKNYTDFIGKLEVEKSASSAHRKLLDLNGGQKNYAAIDAQPQAESRSLSRLNSLMRRRNMLLFEKSQPIDESFTSKNLRQVRNALDQKKSMNYSVLESSASKIRERKAKVFSESLNTSHVLNLSQPRLKNFKIP